VGVNARAALVLALAVVVAGGGVAELGGWLGRQDLRAVLAGLAAIAAAIAAVSALRSYRQVVELRRVVDGIDAELVELLREHDNGGRGA